MSYIFLKIANKFFNLPFIGNKIKFLAKLTFNSINLFILTIKKIIRIVIKLPRFFFKILKFTVAIIRFNNADKNKIKIILHKVAKRIYYLPFFQRYFNFIEELISDKISSTKGIDNLFSKKEIDNLIISTPIALREYKRELRNLGNEIKKLKVEKNL
mgnify:CR=1 FL=1